MITFAFFIFLVVHGLIHLLGFAKAFGYADLPALTAPVTPVMGIVWQLAAWLMLAAALAIYGWPRIWWVVGGLAVVASMTAIVPSWEDARAGALANGLVVVGVIFGALTYGPTSLRAEYEHDVEAALSTPRGTASDLVTADDLSALPEPVRRYLQASGVVGQPRVVNMAARMHGRIRATPDAAWMPFAAEQHDVFSASPVRLFYMTASRAFVPVQGYHRFMGPSASMRIIAAASWPVVDLSGDDLSVSETVTLLNDMVVLAPAALLTPRVTWGPVFMRQDGAHAVQAQFSHLGRTISAELVIGPDGTLRDFVSDDRSATAPDATTMTRRRWSTPVGDPHAFGPVRLASRGEGRWHDGERTWTYLQLTVDEVRYNVEP